MDTSKTTKTCARVSSVIPQSPADDAGFEEGCFVVSVDGKAVRDMIDWRWLTSDDVIELGYIDSDGDGGTVVLQREPGQDWGFEFEGVVFDGVMQCRNACTFCFMRQLPNNMRPSLTLRDDDFRLSFLAGTFVTLTNLSPQDELRIVEQHISPLRVSLHAIMPAVRERMIGRHARHGFDVLNRLLDAGIEFHAQIVLVPGQNDGEVLQHTLAWAWEHPGILDVCVVPLGFTKYQNRFDHSFNDPAAAFAVLDLLAPFQARAQRERGERWVFAADEFYRNAYGENLLQKLPGTKDYGDFAMFEDGVGLIRSFVDDWQHADETHLIRQATHALSHAHLKVCYLAGCASREFLAPLVARTTLAPYFEPLFVKNNFFGGNVDVTGLLCGCDITEAITGYMKAHANGEVHKTSEAHKNDKEHKSNKEYKNSTAFKDVQVGALLFAIPRVVFNDDGVTLDDMTLEDIEKRTGARVAVVSCNASDFLAEIINIAKHSAYYASGRSNL